MTPRMTRSSATWRTWTSSGRGSESCMVAKRGGHGSKPTSWSAGQAVRRPVTDARLRRPLLASLSDPRAGDSSRAGQYSARRDAAILVRVGKSWGTRQLVEFNLLRGLGRRSCLQYDSLGASVHLIQPSFPPGVRRSRVYQVALRSFSPALYVIHNPPTASTSALRIREFISSSIFANPSMHPTDCTLLLHQKQEDGEWVVPFPSGGLPSAARGEVHVEAELPANAFLAGQRFSNSAIRSLDDPRRLENHDC